MRYLRLTLLSVVGDRLQIDEMRSDNGRFDWIVVPELDFDPLTERREHLGEYQLLVPHGGVAVLFHAGFALKRELSAPLKGCNSIRSNVMDFEAVAYKLHI